MCPRCLVGRPRQDIEQRLGCGPCFSQYLAGTLQFLSDLIHTGRFFRHSDRSGHVTISRPLRDVRHRRWIVNRSQHWFFARGSASCSPRTSQVIESVRDMASREISLPPRHNTIKKDRGKHRLHPRPVDLMCCVAVNRLVRTRMPGGVADGGKNPSLRGYSKSCSSISVARRHNS